MTNDERGFGIYIHWPFCLAKCPYCDFNSHVRDKVDQAAWRDALLTEIDRWAEQTQGRTVTSIFFGGGTPSLMPPATVDAVLQQIAQRWAVEPDLEITLEANPTSVEAAAFADLAKAGVNRVSLGVQALDDESLKQLGRQHSAREALDAVALAAKQFARFSFDLIYARPHQTRDAWERELRQALTHADGHLSVYQLTIEPGTVFEGKFRRGELQIPDEETQAVLYEDTQAILRDAGMPAYEISNHARPGAESRHNLTYWRYGDYVGIGPGAHGRVTIDGVKYATRAHRAPEIWLERAAANTTTDRTRIEPAERGTEALLMGLRLVEGVPLQRLTHEAGVPLSRVIDLEAVARLERGGFVRMSDERLVATAAGLERLNAVLAALVI
ncbi:radical SAM family heme chaperone HemW [Roseiterribacter gracilis]|uniref:Heme chaperone HemW n=1 Tax=Roseiterribacter gracilis TaxID=2812848 RepID=A0A8S8XDB6_9PROT|nr:coproporphyrinogen III oxidase [Rhodospirillales bacterium TMPK1]